MIPMEEIISATEDREDDEKVAADNNSLQSEHQLPLEAAPAAAAVINELEPPSEMNRPTMATESSCSSSPAAAAAGARSLTLEPTCCFEKKTNATTNTNQQTDNSNFATTPNLNNMDNKQNSQFDNVIQNTSLAPEQSSLLNQISAATEEPENSHALLAPPPPPPTGSLSEPLTTVDLLAPPPESLIDLTRQQKVEGESFAKVNNQQVVEKGKEKEEEKNNSAHLFKRQRKLATTSSLSPSFIGSAAAAYQISSHQQSLKDFSQEPQNHRATHEANTLNLLISKVDKVKSEVDQLIQCCSTSENKLGRTLDNFERRISHDTPSSPFYNNQNPMLAASSALNSQIEMKRKMSHGECSYASSTPTTNASRRASCAYTDEEFMEFERENLDSLKRKQSALFQNDWWSAQNLEEEEEASEKLVILRHLIQRRIELKSIDKQLFNIISQYLHQIQDKLDLPSLSSPQEEGQNYLISTTQSTIRPTQSVSYKNNLQQQHQFNSYHRQQHFMGNISWQDQQQQQLELDLHRQAQEQQFHQQKQFQQQHSEQVPLGGGGGRGGGFLNNHPSAAAPPTVIDLSSSTSSTSINESRRNFSNFAQMENSSLSRRTSSAVYNGASGINSTNCGLMEPQATRLMENSITSSNGNNNTTNLSARKVSFSVNLKKSRLLGGELMSSSSSSSQQQQQRQIDQIDGHNYNKAQMSADESFYSWTNTASTSTAVSAAAANQTSPLNLLSKRYRTSVCSQSPPVEFVGGATAVASSASSSSSTCSSSLALASENNVCVMNKKQTAQSVASSSALPPILPSTSSLNYFQKEQENLLAAGTSFQPQSRTSPTTSGCCSLLMGNNNNTHNPTATMLQQNARLLTQPHYLHQQQQQQQQQQQLIKTNQNNLANSSELAASAAAAAVVAASNRIAYRCHVCGSGFEDRHRLQQHLSIHLNLHPSWFEERTIKKTMAQYEAKRGDYLCNNCHIRFETTAEFDKHMQLHGDKPHQCDLCTQDNKLVSFRYYRQLLTHLRSHCFLYSCRFVPECKQTSNRKDYLKLHILKHHLNNKLPEQYTICCH